MTLKGFGMSLRNKLTFKVLESLTQRQKDISNWLLLYCIEKTVRYNSDSEEKEIRREKLNDYKDIMPNFEYSDDFHTLVKDWWNNEKISWRHQHCKKHIREQLKYGMIYRLLVIFFKNHNNSPFFIETEKGPEPDNQEFQEK